MVNIAPSVLTEFQISARDILGGRLHSTEVRTEWRTEFGNRHYSPRLDIATGPFATGRLRFGRAYDRLSELHESLLREVFRNHVINLTTHGEESTTQTFEQALNFNYNARCFIGVEIENRVNRKHLMGGALNASALSRIAILIGWTDEKVKAFVKLRSYLAVLSQANKPTFATTNMLILSPIQFWECISGNAAT